MTREAQVPDPDSAQLARNVGCCRRLWASGRRNFNAVLEILHEHLAMKSTRAELSCTLADSNEFWLHRRV